MAPGGFRRTAQTRSPDSASSLWQQELASSSGLFAASGEEERLPKLDLDLAADLGLSSVSGISRPSVSDQVSSH